MSDLPPSPDIDDASAALDGDPAAARRADRALVVAMRAVRDELADVPPAPDEVRQRAIAAALGEFGAAPVSLDHRRSRRHRQRWLGAAAAAVVVLLGVAAVTTLSGDDAEDSASEAVATAVADAESTDAVLAAETETASEATDARATSAAAAEDASETTAAGATGGGDGFPIDGPADVLPILQSPADLVTYAAELTPVTVPAAAAPDAGAASTTAVHVTVLGSSCDLQGLAVLGEVSYQGRPAFAVRDTASGELRAIAVADCTVLVEITP
jgi:cytoskeletal protein RodZ